MASVESTTMVVVVSLLGTNFGIRTIWSDAGVLELRVESLMVKRATATLVAIAL